MGPGIMENANRWLRAACAPHCTALGTSVVARYHPRALYVDRASSYEKSSTQRPAGTPTSSAAGRARTSTWAVCTKGHQLSFGEGSRRQATCDVCHKPIEKTQHRAECSMRNTLPVGCDFDMCSHCYAGCSVPTFPVLSPQLT
jgi:hypothetical protein